MSILRRRTGTYSRTVLLQAAIDKRREGRDHRLISAYPMLAPAAIEALKPWVYHPYVFDQRSGCGRNADPGNFALSPDLNGGAW